jgi:hypothetical protein
MDKDRLNRRLISRKNFLLIAIGLTPLAVLVGKSTRPRIENLDPTKKYLISAKEPYQDKRYPYSVSSKLSIPVEFDPEIFLLCANETFVPFDNWIKKTKNPISLTLYPNNRFYDSNSRKYRNQINISQNAKSISIDLALGYSLEKIYKDNGSLEAVSLASRELRFLIMAGLYEQLLRDDSFKGDLENFESNYFSNITNSYPGLSFADFQVCSPCISV